MILTETFAPVKPSGETSGGALFVIEGIRVFLPLWLPPEDARKAMRRINLRINEYLDETEKLNGPR